MKNSAIYIDYDNVSITVQDYYKKPANKVIQELRKGVFQEEEKLRLVKAFCDFTHIETKEMRELDKLLVELRHISSASSKGKGNASDIGLAIDVVKSLYNNTPIDKYYIISSDSDMFNLIKELLFFNKEVVLIYSEKNISREYKQSLIDAKIEVKSIESILNVPVYVDLTSQTLISELPVHVMSIHKKISAIKKQYHGKGTTGESDVRDELEKTKSSSDSLKIFEYLKENDYIKQFTKQGRDYYVMGQNSFQYLNDEEIVTEEELR